MADGERVTYIIVLRIDGITCYWNGSEFGKHAQRYLTRFVAEREAVRAVMLSPGAIGSVEVREERR